MKIDWPSWLLYATGVLSLILALLGATYEPLKSRPRLFALFIFAFAVLTLVLNGWKDRDSQLDAGRASQNANRDKAAVQSKLDKANAELDRQRTKIDRLTGTASTLQQESKDLISALTKTHKDLGEQAQMSLLATLASSKSNILFADYLFKFSRGPELNESRFVPHGPIGPLLLGVQDCGVPLSITFHSRYSRLTIDEPLEANRHGQSRDREEIIQQEAGTVLPPKEGPTLYFSENFTASHESASELYGFARFQNASLLTISVTSGPRHEPIPVGCGRNLISYWHKYLAAGSISFATEGSPGISINFPLKRMLQMKNGVPELRFVVSGYPKIQTVESRWGDLPE
jgi:hypothetical protein